MVPWSSLVGQQPPGTRSCCRALLVNTLGDVGFEAHAPGFGTRPNAANTSRHTTSSQTFSFSFDPTLMALNRLSSAAHSSAMSAE
jgi:hypothetical protein